MDENVNLPKKPGALQAIAICTLVSGILNCLAGLAWVFSVFGIPLAAYCIVLGILEILYATKLMASPIKATKPAKYIAIMQIINIISGSVTSVAAGIVALVLYNNDDVKACFREN